MSYLRLNAEGCILCSYESIAAAAADLDVEPSLLETSLAGISGGLHLPLRWSHRWALQGLLYLGCGGVCVDHRTCIQGDWLCAEQRSIMCNKTIVLLYQ